MISGRRLFWITIIVVVVVVLVVFLSIGLAIGLTKDSSSSSRSSDSLVGEGDGEDAKNAGPTYEQVQQRGFIRCGIYNQSYGFSFPNEGTGIHEGMNIDQVRM
jgi:hypothetical protein